MSFPTSELGGNSFLSRFPPAKIAREVESPQKRTEEELSETTESVSGWQAQDESETPIPLKGYYAQFRWEHMPEVFGQGEGGVSLEFVNELMKDEAGTLLNLLPIQTRPVASIPSQFHRIICVLQFALQSSDGFDQVPAVMDKRVIKSTGRKLGGSAQEPIPGLALGYNLCHRPNACNTGLSLPQFDKDGDFVSFQNPVSTDKRAVQQDASGNEYVVVACRREHVSLLYNAGLPNAPPPKTGRSLRGRNRRGNRVKTVVNTSDYVAGEGPLDGMLTRAGICPHAVSVFYYTSHGVQPIGGRTVQKDCECTCNCKDLTVMSDNDGTSFRESNNVQEHCVNGVYIHPYIRDIVNTENVNSGEQQVNSGIGGHITTGTLEEDKKFYTPRSNRNSSLISSNSSASSSAGSRTLPHGSQPATGPILRFNEWNENLGITDDYLLKLLEPHDIEQDPVNETDNMLGKMGIGRPGQLQSAENPMVRNQLKHTLSVIEQQTKVHRDRAASTLQSNERINTELRHTVWLLKKLKEENESQKRKIKQLTEGNNANISTTSSSSGTAQHNSDKQPGIVKTTAASPPHTHNLDFIVNRQHLNPVLGENLENLHSPMKRLRSPTYDTAGAYKRLVVDSPMTTTESVSSSSSSIPEEHSQEHAQHTQQHDQHTQHIQQSQPIQSTQYTQHTQQPLQNSQHNQLSQPLQHPQNTQHTLGHRKQVPVDDEKNFDLYAKDNMKMVSE